SDLTSSLEGGKKPVTLETESTAADEDENTQADQNDGEQYMFPAFEDLGDGRTGGNEFRQQDQNCHQDEEDDAVGDDRGGSHIEEDGDVDADIVAAVGKRHPGDGQDTHLLPGDLPGVIVVIIAPPGLPGRP